MSEELARPPSREFRSRAAELTAPAESARSLAVSVLCLTLVDVFHSENAPAVRLDQNPLNQRPGAKRYVGVGERDLEAAGLGVHLAAAGVGISVPWGRRALQPSLDVDAERQRERMQAGAPQPLANLGDRRFVGDRRVRVGRRMRRLGRIVAEAAANLVERLGAAVPRLQLVIGERPARRRALRVLDEERSPATGSGSEPRRRAWSRRRRNNRRRD